jgi:hypothetical protein
MMFIDSLFKGAFAAEQVSLPALPSSLKHAIGQSSSTGSLSFGATTVKVFVGSTLVVIGVATTLLVRSSERESLPSNSGLSVADSISVKSDSVSMVSIATKDSNAAQSIIPKLDTAKAAKEEVKRVPLVVKKKVIVRDTIIMRRRK